MLITEFLLPFHKSFIRNQRLVLLIRNLVIPQKFQIFFGSKTLILIEFFNDFSLKVAGLNEVEHLPAVAKNLLRFKWNCLESHWRNMVSVGVTMLTVNL